MCLYDENGNLVHQTEPPETVPDWDEISKKPYKDMILAMRPIVKAFLKAKADLKVKFNILSKPFKKDS
jgi:hypothetical protein